MAIAKEKRSITASPNARDGGEREEKRSLIGLAEAYDRLAFWRRGREEKSLWG